MDFLALYIYLILLLPLASGVLVGITNRVIPKQVAHWLTTSSVAIVFFLSLYLVKWICIDHHPVPISIVLYTWLTNAQYTFHIGVLIDALSATLVLVVSFISLLVHIYSIGYMQEDPGYQRFFSYIALFTFAMLTLVLADNFLQLFFGWEAVGLVSYLLIGFWFQKESANQASLKAFLVNRVGDMGFLLGIALIFAYFHSLNYTVIFSLLPNQLNVLFPYLPLSVISLICILLFIGAAGKSAQIPLHVWLPESMEGPTPISALIHAATMVTAGIYMIARLSPLYIHSSLALNILLFVGASGALMMGTVALVQYDIKRIVAYSTLSQLGYMVAGLGASAFSASIFHLMTHACFKALLFLAAGSVILYFHHQQDIRYMGGIHKYLKLTSITFLIGALALSGIPPFAGFYSKEAILQAIKVSPLSLAPYAYYCSLIGVFITALYIFKTFFFVFYTKPRWQEENPIPKEEPVIAYPLVILSLSSITIGFLLADPILYNTAQPWFAHSMVILPLLQKESLNIYQAFKQIPVLLALGGIIIAALVVFYPKLGLKIQQYFPSIYRILVAKYGFDFLNHWIFVKGGQALSHWLYHKTECQVLDGTIVNGSGRFIIVLSNFMRRLQTGYLYHYALSMLLGVIFLLTFLFFKFKF